MVFTTEVRKGLSVGGVQMFQISTVLNSKPETSLHFKKALSITRKCSELETGCFELENGVIRVQNTSKISPFRMQNSFQLVYLFAQT